MPDKVTYLDAVRIQKLYVQFGKREALRDIEISIPSSRITAVIGPSGSGKTTLLRCINRINELEDGCRTSGQVYVQGQDIYATECDVRALRRRVGMVFQQPLPFDTSIYNNVVYAVKLQGKQSRLTLDTLVEKNLRAVGLWDDVKDMLRKSPADLTLGQKQRLCIARALAAQPEILLLDEPTSELGTGATMLIEELLRTLSARHTIVVALRNVQQAVRLSDRCAFLLGGELVEVGDTGRLFSAPVDDRTEAYIAGQLVQ